MGEPPLIWALTDGRAGNSTQSLGLAERLSAISMAEGGHPQVVEMPVALSALAGLPNRLLRRPWGIAAETRRALLEAAPPRVAIATGRRLSPMLRALKARHPEIMAIQLMDPELPYRDFDRVVLPSHDRRGGANVIESLGAPNRVTQAKIAEAAAKARLRLHLVPPVTALLLGGSTDRGAMTPEDARQLWEQMAPLRRGSLLVTTSRRTPLLVAAYLKEVVTPPHQLFLYGERAATSGTENPYLAFLGLADRLVVSADSVSMLSEAAVTGKPVYHFLPEAVVKDKHRRLIAALEAAGHVRPLAAFDPAWTGGEPLDEAGRIAGLLRIALGWGEAGESAESGEAPFVPLFPSRPAAGTPHLRLIEK